MGLLAHQSPERPTPPLDSFLSGRLTPQHIRVLSCVSCLCLYVYICSNCCIYCILHIPKLRSLHFLFRDGRNYYFNVGTLKVGAIAQSWTSRSLSLMPKSHREKKPGNGQSWWHIGLIPVLRLANLCKFRASLVYKLSIRPSRATWWDPTSKTNQLWTIAWACSSSWPA